ncbi:hypothetical protein [Ralstonia pseudosolanacearum]|uniref:hypothetical protein n=1 Tax=Ralstonia pseudosolanacearum TaxID=1310165 RepID=UPI00125EF58A|nr:hypothetical protein [Ralstonia pseudosolanacearum]
MIHDFITAIIVALGWFVYHHFSKSRDTVKIRRDIQFPVLHELTKSILRISSTSHKNVGDISEEDFHAYWKGMMSIQLLGTPEHIKMAQDIMEDLCAPGKVVELNPMIESLRDTLRELLELPKVEGPVSWLGRIPGNPALHILQASSYKSISYKINADFRP